MKYDETVRAVNKIISQYSMALTLRQIYYRLVAATLIPNQRSAYNSLSSQLVKARENEEVDDNSIVDRSRSITDISFDTPRDFLGAVKIALQYRFVRRFWGSQETYVELWVEKDALSEVLSGAIKEFNTIVAPSRGYSSYSYLKDAASRIDKYAGEYREALILHFADHDPSGIDMTRDLEERLNRYCDYPVAVRRIALTFDQVKKYNLIPNPTKLADPRSADYIARHGDECWELDAIEPDELVRLCQEAVKEQINAPSAWEEAKGKEQADRLLILGEVEELERRLRDIGED